MNSENTFTAILPNGNEIQIGLVNGMPHPFLTDEDGQLIDILPAHDVEDEQLGMDRLETLSWATKLQPIEAECESFRSINVGRGHYGFSVLVNCERFHSLTPMPEWHNALKSDDISDEDLEDVKNNIAIHILEDNGINYTSITIK